MIKLDAEQTVHLAAQYMSAFAINFIPSREDDSHTNLGFDPVNKTLSTREFGENDCRMLFDYESFSLKIVSIETSYSLSLDGRSHFKVFDWINEKLLSLGVEKFYEYSFHYEIPYVISQDYIFKAPSSEKLTSLLSIRILADKSLTEFLSRGGYAEEIRIWPHHFDTGAFFTFKEGLDRQMGIGLAIADDMINEPYFYAAGYDENGAIDVSDFEDLEHGHWVMNGFKGAVLKNRDLNPDRVVAFFKVAMRQFSL